MSKLQWCIGGLITQRSHCGTNEHRHCGILKTFNDRRCDIVVVVIKGESAHYQCGLSTARWRHGEGNSAQGSCAKLRYRTRGKVEGTRKRELVHLQLVPVDCGKDYTWSEGERGGDAQAVLAHTEYSAFNLHCTVHSSQISLLSFPHLSLSHTYTHTNTPVPCRVSARGEHQP